MDVYGIFFTGYLFILLNGLMHKWLTCDQVSLSQESVYTGRHSCDSHLTCVQVFPYQEDHSLGELWRRGELYSGLSVRSDTEEAA